MEREEIQAAATTSETSNLAVTSWEQVVFHAGGTEEFENWKEKHVPKILPELLPIVNVIVQNAVTQDTYDVMTMDWTKCGHFILWGNTCDLSKIDRTRFGHFCYKLATPVTVTFSEILSAFDNAWYLVKETWINHVGRYAPTGTIRKICARHAPISTVREICADKTLEPYNLLGPTAKYWLKKSLATSEEWQAFLTTLHAWYSENEGGFPRWTQQLQGASSAWKQVSVAFRAWHVKSPIAFRAWQAVEKNCSMNFAEVS
jgi:hypothetical protein